MAIGLTTEQLFAVFLDQIFKRLNEVKGELEASKAGESPMLANALTKIREQYHLINVEQATAILGTVVSFFDTIVANNHALAKTIPHLES